MTRPDADAIGYYSAVQRSDPWLEEARAALDAREASYLARLNESARRRQPPEAHEPGRCVDCRGRIYTWAPRCQSCARKKRRPQQLCGALGCLRRQRVGRYCSKHYYRWLHDLPMDDPVK